MMRTTLLRSNPFIRTTAAITNLHPLGSCSLLAQKHQRRSDATVAAPPSESVTNTTTPLLEHAISNPTLANIEKRWETMPPPEQAELWMALRKRMKVVNWAEMTLQEKKAAYWIAFGPHGPRALDPPGENMRVLGYSALGIAVSFVIFVIIRAFARPPPKTMTKEWQEMTNDYLKSQNSEPISGISSAGYSGKGAVQSAPEKKN